jgi:hypothetical protein
MSSLMNPRGWRGDADHRISGRVYRPKTPLQASCASFYDFAANQHAKCQFFHEKYATNAVG